MSKSNYHTVTASSGGGEIPIWTTSSGSGKRPGLLLVPAIFGIDEGTKTLARDIASTGAHVWVVDPFWRTEPGPIGPRDKEGFSRAIARVKNLDVQLATKDYADLIRAICQEEDCNSKVAIMGVCFAGKFALLLTSQGHASAGASVHGTGMAAMAELEAKISAPLSLHFGDEDVATPVADVATLQEAFKGHDNVEVVLHEGGIKHGFSDPGSNDFSPDVYKKTLAAVHGLLNGLR